MVPVWCSLGSNTFVGMSWHVSDERKMVDTFGYGRCVIENFVDAATVAKELGYVNCGLASLAERVLGVAITKSKQASE